MMREAVHIFLKDSRYLRVPIAIVLAWMGIFLVTSAAPLRPFERIDGWSDTLGYVVPNLSMYVLPAGWWFLISRAFHADAIPGDRQFWLTRPYRRSSLLGAKALFVLAYVLLPLALAQVTAVVVRGFPLGPSIAGMLWSHFVILAIVVLPAAALSAVTSKLTQFIVVALAAPPLIVANNLLTPWAALEWIRASVAICIVATVTGTILYVQFARRRTGTSRLIALTGSLALVAAVSFLPWRTAFALQSQVGPRWDGQLTAEFVRRPQPRADRPSFVGGPLLFQLTGLPAGTPISCEGAEATIEARGEVWRTGIEIPRVPNVSKIEDGCQLSVSDALINQVGTDPASIHAILYITAFGPEQPTSVPIGQPPTVVQNTVLCSGATRRSIVRVRSETIDNSLTAVACQSAFRDPRGLILLSSPPSGEQRLSRFSYSPFPADLRIPAAQYVAFFNLRPVEEVTLAIREPIAHVRVAVEAQNVLLQDVLR
jgi:hypothetical protein